MTISSETSRISYTGNGATATYSYTYRILDDDDIRVTVRDTSGVETTLTKTTDYTVTGVGAGAGGTVVLVSSGQAWLTSGFLTTGYVLTIRRILAMTQPTSITNEGAFYAEAHEEEFDRLVMQLQTHDDDIDRSIKIPETEAASSFTLTLPTAANRASKVLGFDADGNVTAVANVPTSGVTASAYMETVLDDTSAAAARTTLGFAGTGGTAQAANLEADAVTTVKILDANVTEAKISEAGRAKMFNYGASAVGTDAYALTPSPAFTAYASGMLVSFKADVANTGACTLNLNALGAKAIKVVQAGSKADPGNGVIKAGDFVTAIYDGTDMVITSLSSQVSQTSYVLVHTGNGASGGGYGTTNTKIRTFTTLASNTGTAITRATAAADGDSFTINESGLYSVVYTDGVSNPAGMYMGISKNSNQLTTSPHTITESHRLALGSVAIDSYTTLSWTGHLAAGDIIRAHSNPGTTVNTDATVRFLITKVA